MERVDVKGTSNPGCFELVPVVFVFLWGLIFHGMSVWDFVLF